MERKDLVIAILLTAIVSVALTYGTMDFYYSQKKHASITLEEKMFLVYELMNGRVEYQVHNVITDKGENMSLQYVFKNFTSLLKLAVGNVSAPLQTKTALTDVYADPTDGSYVTATLSNYWLNGGDIARNMTYKWTFEETVNLNAGASYISNTTYAYNMANFSGGAQTFNSGENLTVRMVFTHNAND